MKRHEYEILDACVEGVWELSRRFYQVYPKGMELAESAERLARMLKEGDLFAVLTDSLRGCTESFGSYDYSGVPLYMPTVDEILSSFAESTPKVAVGLTKQGAALWEATAKPDWDLYIGGETREFDVNNKQGPWEAHIWSRTRAGLEQAIQFQWLGEAIPGTEAWESISPWRATYWKTLPDGYHVRLLTNGPDSGTWSEEKKKWLQTTDWHRHPSTNHGTETS